MLVMTHAPRFWLNGPPLQGLWQEIARTVSADCGSETWLLLRPPLGSSAYCLLLGQTCCPEQTAAQMVLPFQGRRGVALNLEAQNLLLSNLDIFKCPFCRRDKTLTKTNWGRRVLFGLIFRVTAQPTIEVGQGRESKQEPGAC